MKASSANFLTVIKGPKQFGFRIPSHTKRIAARTSVKRAISVGICSMEIFYIMKLRFFLIICVFILLSACGNNSDSSSGRKAVYVKPSIDYKGKFRKGHVRRPVSTKKDAIKSQNRSRYYYHTRGKYRRKKN